MKQKGGVETRQEYLLNRCLSAAFSSLRIANALRKALRITHTHTHTHTHMYTFRRLVTTAASYVKDM